MVFACCKQVPAAAEERMTTFSTRPVLHYFDLPGRGECIRLAFIGGGISFEDKRYSFEEFATHGKQLSPSGKFPVLEMDGKYYVESLGILDYVCALSKHVPRNAHETLISCMITHQVDQVWEAVAGVVQDPSDSKRQEVEKELKEVFQKLDEVIREHREESAHLIKGLSFCPADLTVVGAVVSMEHHLFGLNLGDMKTQFPNVYAIKEGVLKDNKAIRDHYSS